MDKAFSSGLTPCRDQKHIENALWHSKNLLLLSTVKDITIIDGTNNLCKDSRCKWDYCNRSCPQENVITLKVMFMASFKGMIYWNINVWTIISYCWNSTVVW